MTMYLVHTMQNNTANNTTTMNANHIQKVLLFDHSAWSCSLLEHIVACRMSGRRSGRLSQLCHTSSIPTTLRSLQPITLLHSPTRCSSLLTLAIEILLQETLLLLVARRCPADSDQLLGSLHPLPTDDKDPRLLDLG
jgi:hypothetical protein